MGVYGMVCTECGGEGELEYERAVVDWIRGGYLEGYMNDCEKCNGTGEIGDGMAEE
tara:strand:+ start:1367 stop:1534 length:168 start_codon:yes stop_codon:yes gene_type:complete